MQYDMFDAKNELTKLVQIALAGEDVVLAKDGIPVVKLVKINTPETKRKPGAWADLPKVDEYWEAPVSHSKDALLQKAPQALLRAAEKARQLAEQTGTPFVTRKSVTSPAKADKQK